MQEDPIFAEAGTAVLQSTFRLLPTCTRLNFGQTRVIDKTNAVLQYQVSVRFPRPLSKARQAQLLRASLAVTTLVGFVVLHMVLVHRLLSPRALTAFPRMHRLSPGLGASPSPQSNRSPAGLVLIRQMLRLTMCPILWLRTIVPHHLACRWRT